MIVNSSHDIYVFVWCFFCGVVAGVLFDVFRALRKNIKFGTGAIAFQDALYCAMSFYIFTKTVDITNNGELRWYEFAGLFFGTVIYFLHISRFALLLFTKICAGINRVFLIMFRIVKRIMKFVITPFFAFAKLFKKFSIFALNNAKHVFKKVYKSK